MSKNFKKEQLVPLNGLGCSKAFKILVTKVYVPLAKDLEIVCKHIFYNQD